MIQAYALAHGGEAARILEGAAGSAFAKDALEALLGNLTDPKYEGKMLVILAGYERHLGAVLASNPGMARRFSERLEFEDWAPGPCVELVRARLAKERLKLPRELDASLLAGFAELSARDGWGNAGDAVTVANKIQAAFEVRDSGEGMDMDASGAAADAVITAADVDTAFGALLKQRKHSAATGGSRGASEPDASMVAPPATAAATTFLKRKAEKSAERRGAPPERPPRIGQDGKGAHGEATREAVQRALPPLDNGVLLASLQLALRELGYDLERALDIVARREMPDELLELVADKAGASVAAVRPALLAQCPALQPRLEAALEQQKAEVERQRLAENAIELAGEAERARLREEEAERQRRQMGAFICGVCGRMGCPVMPIWRTWNEGGQPPANTGRF